MKKSIVFTSIFNPTEAIKKFKKLLSNQWKIIVIADKKTPKEWYLENVEFYSLEKQKKLDFYSIKNIPFNNYARKNIGYLVALKNKSDLISESDDDNIPYDYWESTINNFINFDFYTVYSDLNFFNIYTLFTKEKIWPRGFPLNLIKKSFINEKKINLKKIKKEKIYNKIGIIQFLADNDPDVDAIYRLVIGKILKFENKNDIFILEKKIFSPFNSQNTVFFKKEYFPLLYLPSFVSIRATDIYRGIIAQRILWEDDNYLAIGKATVYQKRNIHDYIKDFYFELPVYFNIEKMSNILINYDFRKNNIIDKLLESYIILIKNEIIPKKEINILKSWIKDCDKLFNY